MSPPLAHPPRNPNQALPLLPNELFLTILDHLVENANSSQPVAYTPSHPITKTLRALTRVSRAIYPVATRYLYAHCVYLDSLAKYTLFRRTLGFELGIGNPLAVRDGEVIRNEELWGMAGAMESVTSMFISPFKVEEEENQRRNSNSSSSYGKHVMPLLRLPQIIDLLRTLGRTLKRLALDLTPVYAPASEVELLRPHSSANNPFLQMLVLEEVVVSFDVTDYFPRGPPNLKRLAITCCELEDTQIEFYLGSSALEIVFLLRPPKLEAKHIGLVFESLSGRSSNSFLDVVLVDVNANHRTPKHTRSWKDDDRVRIWEVDVPTSYYGDTDALVLCDNWIWTQGVQGTLWEQEKRRMRSWGQVTALLGGLSAG